MAMKKFINDSETLTKELLKGMALAFPDKIEVRGNNLVINKNIEKADRVHIVTLGGAGHEPALSGFVGDGMFDISVVGDVFAAPGPAACFEALSLAAAPKGALFVVLNHAGDMMTAEMTMEQVEDAGIKVARVTTQEDISNAPRSDGGNRRGLVGCIPLAKIAGGAAAMGRALEAVRAVAQKFADNMATIAVACRGATHPANGAEISHFDDKDMEIGMGQHGEGGGGRMTMKSARETAAIMTQALLDDLSIEKGEEVMLIVNGSGATTLMEQLIVFKDCVDYLKDKGVKVAASHVGELLTVQEAAGFQLFMARMDDEMMKYWKAPCDTPYYTVK